MSLSLAIPKSLTLARTLPRNNNYVIAGEISVDDVVGVKKQ